MRDTQDIGVLELIPQRPPFVMIDRLMHYDEVFSRTALLVREDNIFFSDGALNEYGLMENIAQSCAARIGYKSLTTGEPIKIGMIGAIKDFRILRLPLAGSHLETEIEILSEVFSMTLVSARIYAEGELVAQCEMKIALSETQV